MDNINPIGELMQSTMDNVKNILKVDTVVGEPIYTPDGITLINAAPATRRRFFDLQGREVSRPQHGIYITNGKKIFLR